MDKRDSLDSRRKRQVTNGRAAISKAILALGHISVVKIKEQVPCHVNRVHMGETLGNIGPYSFGAHRSETFCCNGKGTFLCFLLDKFRLFPPHVSPFAPVCFLLNTSRGMFLH